MRALAARLLAACAGLAAAAGQAQEKILALDGARDDAFGAAVSLNGDGSTALVGASLGGSLSGAAYVFARANASWAQQDRLLADDGAAADLFGASVSLSDTGDTALVGANRNNGTGAAYVFARANASWAQQARLAALDGAEGDHLGVSVALSGDGDTALVGASSTDGGAGSAYVFARAAGAAAWAQQARLDAPGRAGGDRFGAAVALSGDGGTALVAAKQEGLGRGAAYVFTRSGEAWALQARLEAGDGAAGDLFGAAVALGGAATALVGASRHNDSRGAAYVFARSGEAWALQEKLTAGDGTPDDDFGHALALGDGGSTALVGAPLDNERGADSGAAYVFRREGAAWAERGKVAAADGGAGDGFGRAVSLSGGGAVALFGVREDDENGHGSGSAYASYAAGQACAAGEFADLFGCAGCPAGSFCPENATAPTACAAGEYCPDEGASARGGPCPAGSFCASPAEIEACPAGSFCVEGVAEPTACDAGEYCPDEGASVRGGPCPAGSYCSTPVQMADCPAGSFCAEGAAEPTACDEGEHCPARAAGSVPCPAGSFCSTPAEVEACPAGSFCVEGATEPTACDAGEYCPDGGASQRGAPCAAGFFCDTPVQMAGCPAGSFCPEGSTTPTACAAGEYCPDERASERGSLCPAGSFCASPSVIAACPAGAFCPEGATAPTACDAGELCPAGSSERGGLCPAGSVCRSPAASAACPAGSFCPEGSAAPTACAAGEHCPEGSAARGGLCPAGSFCASPASSEACPADHFCPEGSTAASPCSTCAHTEVIKAVCTASADTRCGGVPAAAGKSDAELLRERVMFGVAGLIGSTVLGLLVRHVVHRRSRRRHPVADRVRTLLRLGGVSSFRSVPGQMFVLFVDDVSLKMAASDRGAGEVAAAIAGALGASHGFLEKGPCGGCSRMRPSAVFMGRAANAASVAASAAQRLGKESPPAAFVASSSAASIELALDKA